MAAKPKVQFRRTYEETKDDDGTRVLVDRIWPRDEFTRSFRSELKEPLGG